MNDYYRFANGGLVELFEGAFAGLNYLLKV